MLHVTRIVACRKVIVHNDTVRLPVAFARSVDKRSGILKHRHEERDDERLREQVLDRAIEQRALPFPVVLVGIVVAAVALPQGQMTAVKTCRDVKRTRIVLHPRLILVAHTAPHAALVDLPGLAIDIWDTLLNGTAFIDNLEAVRGILVWQDCAYTIIYTVHHGWGKRLPGKSLVGIDNNLLCLGIDNDIVLAPLKTRIAQLCPLGLIIPEILRQGTRNSFVDTLCRQNRYS